jgi:hypothetical protein
MQVQPKARMQCRDSPSLPLFSTLEEFVIENVKNTVLAFVNLTNCAHNLNEPA